MLRVTISHPFVYDLMFLIKERKVPAASLFDDYSPLFWQLHRVTGKVKTYALYYCTSTTCETFFLLLLGDTMQERC